MVGFAITGDGGRTSIRFDLGGPVQVSTRSLADPPRVIIDLPQTEFQLPRGAGQRGYGMIAAFRYGLIDAGKSRIVLDTLVPARVERAEVVLEEAGGAFRLEIELMPTTAAELNALELAEAAASMRPSLSDAAQAPRTGLPERPVVVLDPGHGGIDPGASGARIAEKDLVLGVARRIQQSLVAGGRYEVIMTRASDVFVSLDQRVAISRRANADLFVSIHADALASRTLAKSVRGATVYTLSEQASDDLTRRKADKENAADLLAGFSVSAAGDDQVQGILFDLMRRESLNFSNDFRRTLVGELKPRVILSRSGMLAGPFKVLRQPGTPAVLIELGYISNDEDEKAMISDDWQAKVVLAAVRAVEAHFRARRAAQR